MIDTPNYKIEIVEGSRNWRSGDPRIGVHITRDGKDRTYWDGGEPEDNTFDRDWDWVPDEIEAAFHAGVKHGLDLAKKEQGQ